MGKRIAILIFITGIVSAVWAQSPSLLDNNINFRSHNVVYPAVSGDGRVMIFMTDYSDDGSFIMNMTNYRAGKWQDPIDINIIGSSKVNNWGGYSLNYDGTEIYFSSRRSNGIGKYDLWYSAYKNGEWTKPTNVGKPVNSTGNEGNPSISPDGQRIYFMKCDNMANSDAGGCKLYYSDRSPRGWKEPVEMPGHLNVGNTTSPRIMPDNRTLVFASDRPGGQGGIDQWMTKRSGDHWSEPVNIAPVNTDGNDYFLSITMRSIAYLTTISDNDKKVIAELRLPREYRLDNVIVTQGSVKDNDGNNLAAEVRAYNLLNDSYEVRLRLSSLDEDFVMVLPEGATYDVAFSELRQSKMYHSILVDATELVAPRREYTNIVLPDLEVGLVSELVGVGFEPYTSSVTAESSLELSRLTRLMKQNSQLNIEVGTYLMDYKEDSLKSSEDLTEVRIDTTNVFEKSIRIDTLSNNDLDSLIQTMNLVLSKTLEDTSIANIYMARIAAIDSVEVKHLNSTYHNDRTMAQAEAIRNNLLEQGIDEARIQAKGYRDTDLPVDPTSNSDRVVVVKFLSGINRN